MTVTANVVVPPVDFKLSHTLSANPDLRVEFESVVPLGCVSATKLWVTAEDEDWVRRTFGDDEDVASIEVLGGAAIGLLADVEWADGDDDGFTSGLRESDATCLNGVGSESAWRFRLRFQQRAGLADCFQCWRESGIDLTVESLRTSASVERLDDVSHLTKSQRDTLQEALEAGYFAVPRRVTLEELAERLGISDTATSQRLRRGLESLLEAQFADEPPLDATVHRRP